MFKDSTKGINTGLDDLIDLQFGQEEANRSYLKVMAVDTVLNFVARTMSTLKVELENISDAKDWEYILNVRPNVNQSATEFWQKFYYRLLFRNEILVIFTDDNQLLIADDFVPQKKVLYESSFKDVTIDDYVYQRTFKMSEVIYLENNENQLSKAITGLFNDYGELFGRILEVAMRNNQIRASVSIESTGTMEDGKDKNGKTRAQKIQEYINRVYESFRKNSVAIVPKTKGFDYEEYTNKQGVSNQSLEELNKLKLSLIDDISNMIGVPTALIYGEKSELKQNIEAYRELLTITFVSKLRDELVAKIVSKKEYQNGGRINVKGVLTRNPLEYAVQADKLVSSSTYLIDEVRKMSEHDPLPNGQGKKQLRTKNYEEVGKGGDGKNGKN